MEPEGGPLGHPRPLQTRAAWRRQGLLCYGDQHPDLTEPGAGSAPHWEGCARDEVSLRSWVSVAS